MTFTDPYRDRGRRWRWILVLLVLFALLAFVLPGISVLVTDFLWYRELGRTDIYWSVTWGPWQLGLLVGFVFFLLLFANVLIAIRNTPEDAWGALRQRLHEQAVNIIQRTLRRIVVWGSALITIVFALVAGRMAAPYWFQFLLFTHAHRVGSPDPIFHRDLGFYLFHLPILELISGWLFSGLLIAFILTGLIYVIGGAMRLVRGTPVLAPGALSHLSILLALLLLVKAVQYHLGRFSILTADNGSFIGPNYADIHARMPGLNIMMVVAVLAAVLVLYSIRRRNVVLPLASLLGMVVLSAVVLGLYPAFIQRFRVAPNELQLERPYLTNHLRMTRQAFGLSQVKRLPFSPGQRVESGAITDSPETVSNIRLWDYRPLTQVYSQRQELRPYYTINNVDVDRYQINGQLRQVMTAARELDVNASVVQQSWVTQHLLYTHGYGLVMSPVNEVNPARGEPIFFVSNIPPQSTVPELQVTRPEIYFGELDSEYAVVRSRQREFDYPTSGEENAYTEYQGTAGIPMGNLAVRALAALRFGEMNLLISNYMTKDSRLIFHRQILDRVRSLAPFLFYDADPYLVIGKDGKLYWMLDAYTASTHYPYARYADLQTSVGAITPNYIRNSVKVVIDAYNGSVSFYLADPTDPLAQTWRDIYPELFKPLAAMPDGLRQHIRFPEGLFNTLSDIYQRYHLTEDQVDTFYQSEDLYAIPQETRGTLQGQPAEPMEAYYLVMSLPDQANAEYLLIRPYTPNGKKNMIAWLSARNDPDHFGELLVYDFPKQSQVYGPEQIQASINQEPEISSAVSLWNQSGSQVLWGNLLVIPIDKTILYVQPVYLQAERSQIPELQRIILADQQRIVMRNTLDEAITALTGAATGGTPPPTTTGGVPTAVPANAEQRALARSALDHYTKAQDALRRGDWATYGREMDGVRSDLEKLNGK